MLRVLCLLALSTSSAEAATLFHCVDPEGMVTLDVTRTYDAASNSFDIPAAETQILDDIGYGPADDWRNGGFVTYTNKIVDPWQTQFDFHLSDPASAYDNEVASVRLFHLGEGNSDATGGVISIVAGGAWPVTCSARED